VVVRVAETLTARHGQGEEAQGERARARIGRMTTFLLVLPSGSPRLVTVLVPIGLDLAADWSLLNHGHHLS
jgi:hypothetical protein